jgi:hypothetical protein
MPSPIFRLKFSLWLNMTAKNFCSSRTSSIQYIIACNFYDLKILENMINAQKLIKLHTEIISKNISERKNICVSKFLPQYYLCNVPHNQPQNSQSIHKILKMLEKMSGTFQILQELKIISHTFANFPVWHNVSFAHLQYSGYYHCMSSYRI